MKYIKKFDEINEQNFTVPTNDKIEFVNKVRSALNEYKDAHNKLSELWYEDHQQDIDLNDYLSEDFPFGKSFDDCMVSRWVETAKKNLDSYMNNEADKEADIMDEDERWSEEDDSEDLPPVSGDSLPGGV